MRRFGCLAGGRSGRSQETKSAKQAALQEARTTGAAPVEFSGLEKNGAGWRAAAGLRDGIGRAVSCSRRARKGVRNLFRSHAEKLRRFRAEAEEVLGLKK